MHHGLPHQLQAIVPSGARAYRAMASLATKTCATGTDTGAVAGNAIHPQTLVLDSHSRLCRSDPLGSDSQLSLLAHRRTTHEYRLHRPRARTTSHPSSGSARLRHWRHQQRRKSPDHPRKASPPEVQRKAIGARSSSCDPCRPSRRARHQGSSRRCTPRLRGRAGPRATSSSSSPTP